MAVDVVSKHPSHPLGGFAPLRGVFTEIGANRQVSPLHLLQLALGVGQLSFHVYLVRAVPHRHAGYATCTEHTLDLLVELMITTRRYNTLVHEKNSRILFFIFVEVVRN